MNTFPKHLLHFPKHPKKIWRFDDASRRCLRRLRPCCCWSTIWRCPWHCKRSGLVQQLHMVRCLSIETGCRCVEDAELQRMLKYELLSQACQENGRFSRGLELAAVALLILEVILAPAVATDLTQFDNCPIRLGQELRSQYVTVLHSAFKLCVLCIFTLYTFYNLQHLVSVVCELGSLFNKQNKQSPR